MTPSHLFFCGGIHCSVMVSKSQELCELCRVQPIVDEITELTNEITYIKDKLDGNMTEGQKNDWYYLLHRRQKKLELEKLKLNSYVM